MHLTLWFLFSKNILKSALCFNVFDAYEIASQFQMWVFLFLSNNNNNNNNDKKKKKTLEEERDEK